MDVVRFAAGCLISLVSLSPVSALASDNPDNAPHMPASMVWVLGEQGALRLSTADGQLLMEMQLAPPVRGSTMDHQTGAFWAISGNTVTAYTPGGLPLQSFTVPAQRVSNDIQLAVDSRRHRLWTVKARDIAAFDLDGQLQHHHTLPKPIRAVAVVEGAVWLAVGADLWRLSADGQLMQILSSPFGADIEQLVSDHKHTLWLAGRDRLARLDIANAPQLESMSHPLPLTHIAADGHGGIWLATAHTLHHRNAMLVEDTVLSLDAPDANRIAALTANPQDGAAWFAAGNRIHRAAPGALSSAELFALQDAGVHQLIVLDGWADTVPPEIAITSPNTGALLNDARPPIRVQHDDNATGIDTASLRIVADAIDLDAHCTHADNTAECTPADTLAEGEHILHARIADHAGNIAESDTLQIEIDTVPSVIDITSHENGEWTHQPAQTLAGALSERGTLTLNDNNVSLDIEHRFSIAVTLAEGSNTFSFHAEDLAGNVGTEDFQLQLDTVPPAAAVAEQITIEQQQDGSIRITGAPGTAEPGSTLRITDSASGQTVIVTVNADGSFSAALAADANGPFDIVVIDQAGNASPATTVTQPGEQLPPDPADIAPPLSSTAITPFHEAVDFIYAGANPIQFDVAADTIEPRRVVVLRGKVSTRDGEPLSGAKVTINQHPEYGYTLTRADGAYDIAVNGGGYVTVTLEKENHLPSQRTVKTPWRDYRVVEDIVLVALDPLVTTVELGAMIESVIAQGSVIQDEDGTRQATLLIPTGTAATMTLPDGTQQSLSTINVRATEYTVGDNGPQAMPGPLPPTSAYTYAVELSVDEAIAAGATRVDFSQPLPMYVDNFLNFPVGEIVPLGWYDRAQAVWVPADNGKIIQITGTTAEGLAEIDSDGDEQADDQAMLDALQISIDERRKLAMHYETGDSLWRVMIDHFTPWDCNWPYGPPMDATPPPNESPKRPDAGQPDTKEGNCEGGCIIEAQRRNLGETIPIAGTPYTLNYRSNRMPGYTAGRTIDIPLSGDTVPETLVGIELEVQIVGRSFIETYSPSPNQDVRFVWDGLDGFGRRINGAVTANITVTYLYPMQYYAARDDFAQSFGNLGKAGSGINFEVIGRRNGQYMRLRKRYEKQLPQFHNKDLLGGWTLSTQHIYDKEMHVLYKGNGVTNSNVEIINRTVTTIADANARLSNGSSYGPVNNVLGLSAAPDGSLYFTNYYRHMVVKLGTDGTLDAAAGNGLRGYDGGDGGAATDARLNYPNDAVVGPDGLLYIVDSFNHRIRRVDANGIITTVAGSGAPGFFGDGGPATEARLNHPLSMAIASDGAMYVADYANQRIRRIDRNGVIVTVAGSGQAGYAGDGGPATEAKFYYPMDVIIDEEGILYIADTHNRRIRRVGLDGVIETVAGTGEFGYSGDGGLAVDAKFANPTSLAAGLDGSIYFNDSVNNVIRRISPEGRITTFAGNGQYGFSGDDGPASAARFRNPHTVAVGPDQAVYINDAGNSRIRKVSGTYSVASVENYELVAEVNGDRAFGFDQKGRHRVTVDALTREPLLTFSYDDAGRLVSITDADQNITSIVRDNSGRATTIIAPGGQRTELMMNADGYLDTVTHPDGATHRMSYAEGGLLTAFTTPNNHTNAFDYDTDGFLLRDTDAAGGGWILDTQEDDNAYTVSMTSAEGRQNRYRVEAIPAGGRKQINTAADGTISTTDFLPDATIVSQNAQGVVTTLKRTPDPRFGMQAALHSEINVTLPSDLSQTIKQQRATTLGDPANILSLATQTDTLTVNGKTTTTVFDAAMNTFTTASPQGRQSIIEINDKGRPVLAHIGNLADTAYTYTPEGRLETVTTGEGANTRTTTMTYYTSGPSKGWLHTVTDAENRTVRYEYDLAGRVTKQILPDGREISYGYDANGNLTSITPPGRPAHAFTFTPVDLESDYTPPDVLPGNDLTDYAYNLDKQLELVTRPDGQTIDYVYGATTGKLNEIVIPSGSYSFSYKADSGQLEKAVAPGGEQITYTYDGFLTTSVTASGSINGTVAYVYNNDFRTQALSVNGNTVNFTYDNDGLLTSAGAMILTPDSVNGLLDTTSLGVVTTDNDPNTFGELAHTEAAVSGSDIYSVDYQRDKLGRITQKTETIEGITTTHDYTYDLAGRLDTVTRNGIAISDFDYDTNGNRIAVNGITIGVYDNQDRLLSYTPASQSAGTTSAPSPLGGESQGEGCHYTYTANGELDTRTCSPFPSQGEGQGEGETTTYNYDILGNLRTAILPSGDIIDYIIDGQNRRIGKKVNGVLIQGFLYQDQLNPIAELDGSGNVVARFVYAEKANVPSYMIKSGNTYRIVSDHLGSPRLVINVTNGSIAQQLDYDAFGNVLQDTNPGFQPFGFAGGIYDRDTGLVRFGARDYSPEIGRWVSKDPIGLSGGINVYAYVDNDPINAIDPTGRNKYDKLYGLAKDFWRWYHRQVKRPGDPDLTKQEAETLHNEWKASGKPGPDSKGKHNQSGFVDPSLLLEMLIPFVLTPIELGCGELDCDGDGLIDYDGKSIFLKSCE